MDETEFIEFIEEIIEQENQLSVEEYTLYLEDKVLEYLLPKIGFDTLEISEPEKLSFNLSASWRIDEVIRGGIFKEDARLEDRVLIGEELLGFGGTNFEVYITQGHSKNKAKIIEILDKLEVVLAHNKVWRAHILTIINNARKNGDFSLSLYLYDPGSIIESLLAAFITGKGDSLPLYTLYIDSDNESKTNIYHGLIQWNGMISDITRLFKKHT